MSDLESVDRLLARFSLPRDFVQDCYAASRHRFEGWCAMATGLPADPCDALQVELARWQNRQFGAASHWQLALGICEEAGELMGALESTNGDEIDDAFGDIGIYCAQLATACRLAVGEMVERMPPRIFLQPRAMISVGAGLAAHVSLKHEQRIRGMGSVEMLRIGACAAISTIMCGVRAFGVEPLAIMGSTATRVLRRDWVATPETAGDW